MPVMGRVYLPREDFARFSIDAHALTNGSAPTSRAPAAGVRSRTCARNTTAPRKELLPLIDEDSQPALWTLVEIYQRCWRKSIARNYDVFTRAHSA